MPTHDFQTDVDLIGNIPMVPHMLKVLSGTTGMRFAAIARVTESRWVACSVLDDAGLGVKPADELKIETTLCDQVRGTGEVVHFDDALVDPIYCGHPTPALYGFRSYVSVPITLPDGTVFGTLCGLDPEPREVGTEAVLGMFGLFAGILSEQIGTRQQISQGESDLREERATSGLREQFLAVLGHDLRGPLASIQSCINLLEDQPELDDGALELTRIARQNVGRMVGLIDDLLDLTRGRQGGGIALQRTTDLLLAVGLHQVVEEIAISHPDREIDARIEIPVPIACDVGRVCQLFANLLGNAVTHGDDGGRIAVEAVMEDAVLSISVANGGKPIDPPCAAGCSSRSCGAR